MFNIPSNLFQCKIVLVKEMETLSSVLSNMISNKIPKTNKESSLPTLWKLLGFSFGLYQEYCELQVLTMI